MQPAVGTPVFRAGENVIGNETEARLCEMLAAIERNLNDLVQALNLLGVKRCGHCKKFFRTSNPGALFAAAGEVVCFECIPAWWPLRREQLTCEQRQDTEANLVFWLRNFHSARTLHGSAKLKPNVDVKFELLAKCLECRGTGTYLGDKRCRYCSGPGTVRVIVPDNLR